jgi:hypothetical protein
MTSEHTPLLSGSKSDLPPPSFSSSTTQTNLSKFRKAVGINVHPTGDDDLESARKTARGLYKEVISLQHARKIQYRVVDLLYYLALGSQILIGATLAALGTVAKLHPTSITILGVVNASIGAILAMLKGQGLPDRLRKDEFEMRKVQDFIEETDIRLSILPDDTFTVQNLDDVVQQIFDKYNTARDTAEMNKPSSYAHQNINVAGGAKGDDGTDNDGTNEVGANAGLVRTTVQNKLLEDPAGKGKGKNKLVID